MISKAASVLALLVAAWFAWVAFDQYRGNLDWHNTYTLHLKGNPEEDQWAQLLTLETVSDFACFLLFTVCVVGGTMILQLNAIMGRLESRPRTTDQEAS